MLTLRILSLIFFVSTIYALRCHQASGQSVDLQPSTSATDCVPGNALTCMKTVTMLTRTYTKTCGYANCTHPNGGGQTNLPATCFNTSTPGAEAYTCCCYGDGCNSAPRWSMFFAGATILSLALF